MYSPLNQSKTKLQIPCAEMSEIVMWLFTTSIVAGLVLIVSHKIVRRENLCGLNRRKHSLQSVKTDSLKFDVPFLTCFI